MKDIILKSFVKRGQSTGLSLLGVGQFDGTFYPIAWSGFLGHQPLRLFGSRVLSHFLASVGAFLPLRHSVVASRGGIEQLQFG